MIHSNTYTNTINQIDDYNIFKPDLVKTIRESKEYRHKLAVYLWAYRKRHNENIRFMDNVCRGDV